MSNHESQVIPCGGLDALQNGTEIQHTERTERYLGKLGVLTAHAKETRTSYTISSVDPHAETINTKAGQSFAMSPGRDDALARGATVRFGHGDYVAEYLTIDRSDLRAPTAVTDFDRDMSPAANAEYIARQNYTVIPTSRWATTEMPHLLTVHEQHIAAANFTGNFTPNPENDARVQHYLALGDLAFRLTDERSSTPRAIPLKELPYGIHISGGQDGMPLEARYTTEATADGSTLGALRNHYLDSLKEE